MNTVLKERSLPTGQSIQIIQGDITFEEVDAIVNAANEQLQHGGGVAWAISKGGGPVIQQESDEWIHTHGLVSHTRPAWTSGGKLPAKYVIHAVGPIWGSGDEEGKLAVTVTGSLQVANDLQLESIAFPAISTGIFGFPKRLAAKILLNTLEEYCHQNPDTTVKLIKLVLLDLLTVKAFMEIWEE